MKKCKKIKSLKIQKKYVRVFIAFGDGEITFEAPKQKKI